MFKKLRFQMIANNSWNIYGAVRFFGAAKAKWIKPILGRELQIPKIEYHQTPGEGNDNNHQLVLAEDEEGYRNQAQITSEASVGRLRRRLRGSPASGVLRGGYWPARGVQPVGSVSEQAFDSQSRGILEKVTRAQTTLKNVRLYDVLDSLVPDSAQARLICPDLTAIHQQRTILAASIPLVALRVSTTNLALLTMPA